MNPRSQALTVRPLLSFLVAAAALALVLATLTYAHPTGPVNSQGAGRQYSITVNGVPVSKVKLDGRMVTLRDYSKHIEPAAYRADSYLNLVLDASASQRGYFTAFTKHAQARAYMNAHGIGKATGPAVNRAQGDALRQAQADARSRVQSLGSDSVQLVACTYGIRMVKMYDDSACNGSYLSMIYSDYIANFGTYGHNDKTSSLEVGDCVSNLSVWIDANKGGTKRTFGGGGTVYSTMPIGWNDEISSAKTDNSGVC